MRAMVQKSFLLCIMLLCGSLFQLAAQINVTGVVLDERGETVPGVNIVVKGEAKGTVTDFDGKFGLSVPNASSVLTFSFIGYEKQDIKVGKEKSMTVTLVPESKNLEEVVVVGYQEVRRKDLTGAVAKANMSDMLKTPVARIDQALGGRVAGVQVTSGEGTPGSGFNIVIRGNNSITQANSPLYVIDGFPVEDANMSAINPADIESIDILKDASATAIYGARGANGVVIITSKKGKVGKPVVAYNGSVGFASTTNKIDLLSPVQFIELQQELYSEAEFKKKYLQGTLENGLPMSVADYATKNSWDWQDEVLRTAITNNHHVSLTGGTADTRYASSLSYLNQEGIIINSDYQRFQGRMSLDQRLTSKLKLNVNANYARGITNGSSPSNNESSATNNLMYSVWGYRPVTGDNTDLATSLRDESIDNLANDYRFNPILSAKEEYRKNIQDDLQANTYLEYAILKELKLKISAGYRLRKREQESMNNSKTRYGSAFSTVGSVNGSVREYSDHRWLNENLLTYNKIFNKRHNVNAQIGASFEKAYSKYYRLDVKEITNENMGMAGMGSGIPYLSEASISENSQMSYFARLNYNLDSKYYVTASFRADGSSKFPSTGRWGYFPSGSLAWAFSRESFMEDLTWLSNGKLRASWGCTGNNRVSDFASLAKISSNALDEYSFGNAFQPGYTITALANNKLKWETTDQTNIGLDLGFFEDRISLTTEVYRKVTRDLLLNADLPSHAGIQKAYMNIGKMRNQGLEISLETVNIQTKNFQWTTSFNIAFNESKVLALSRNQNALFQSVTWDNKYNSSYAYIAQVGKPLGTMFGYIYEGTYKYEDFNQDVNGNYTLRADVAGNGLDRNSIQPGDVKYRDVNQDGTVNDKDRVIIGNGAPIHTGGFTNNFTYKGFDLNIFFSWSYGNDILNANRLIFEGGQKRKDLNMFAAYANRWTPENPTSNVPRVGGQGPEGVYSTRVIEDGSFLRLKNMTLGYTFPSSWCKKLTIASARLFVSGENLFTLSNYSGYDPEVSVRNSALTPGFDYSAYPRARTFSGGVSVTF